MNTFVRCGSLFTGSEDEAEKNAVLVYDHEGRLTYVGPEAGAPRRAKADRLIDHSGHFVMPGLIDVHTHLAYGNAKSEEDIDLYSPLEFRALRGLFFAQKCAAAGYTAICSPGDAGQISLSIRDAIRAGLFDGPRVMAAGPYLTTHQGLTDWYPTWIGAPETSIGKLVTNIDEAIEEVRRQVKNGVDCIKLALDGIQRRPDGELIAAFTQQETDTIARESHRLGRKVISHSVGRAATEVNARFMSGGEKIGMLEPGRHADFTVWDGSPLADIRILQDKRRMRAVYIGGKELRLADRPYDPRKVTDFALTNWTDLYTQARVAELRGQTRRLEAAE